MNPDHPSAAYDSKHATAAVADSVSDDPVMLHMELAEQKDHYLRLAADFENLKRRTQRDSEHTAEAEKELFNRDLLPVLDNLERALASGQSISDELGQKRLEMTLQQLVRLLNDHDIEAVEDDCICFDPRRHEAVSLGHDPNQPDYVVPEVVQRGYGHGNELFRPAKVIVNDLGHSPGASHVC